MARIDGSEGGEPSEEKKKSNVTLKTVARMRDQLNGRIGDAVEKFVRDTGVAVVAINVSTDTTGDKIEVSIKIDLDGAL